VKDSKYVPVFTSLVEQRRPATADQQAHIENVDRALVNLKKVSDSGDLTPSAKESVDTLTAAFEGLGAAGDNVSDDNDSDGAPPSRDDAPAGRANTATESSTGKAGPKTGAGNVRR
jgi:hypothetical protein